MKAIFACFNMKERQEGRGRRMTRPNTTDKRTWGEKRRI
jgi:hypothetical protein